MAVQEARRVPVNEVGNEHETDLSFPVRHDASVQVAMTREAQEVQAAMLVAKKFPRDETAAINRIMESCKRKGLAEASQYTFPRGGATVNGPSIRLAETLARAWGNMESGVIELERRDGISTAMAYSWDLETNTREVKVFEVRHLRDTKRGPVKLTDERDIYEMVANTGARRKRACILAVIPGDVQEMAVEQCDKTMEGNQDEPLIDRVRKMVVAFADLGVNQEMLEKRLGHKIDVTSAHEIVSLKKIYASIRDNMAPVGQFFDVPGAAASAASEKTADLNDKLSGKKPAKPAEDSISSQADVVEQEQEEEPDIDLGKAGDLCWNELTHACHKATGVDGADCGKIVRRWLKSISQTRNALKTPKPREIVREALPTADFTKFV